MIMDDGIRGGTNQLNVARDSLTQMAPIFPSFSFRPTVGGCHFASTSLSRQNLLTQMGSNTSSYFSTRNVTNGDGKLADIASPINGSNEQPVEGRRSKSLPKNTLPLLGHGQFGVSCSDIMVSPNDDQPGVFARIFYPCQELNTPETSSSSANFLSWKPEAEYMEGLANFREMSVHKMNFFLDWVMGDKKMPLKWQLPLADGADGKFPVVVFSHGISGNRYFYSTFCTSLASHGFVVAALEHRDGSSCFTYELEKNEGGEFEKKPVAMKKLPHDEREYEMRITQVRRRVDESLGMLRLFEALDRNVLADFEIVLGNEFDWAQFKDRLDLERSISIGHSFGGASALTACAIEKRFKSCVLLDGWLYPFEQQNYQKVTQPVLILCASKWQWPLNVKRLLHLQQQQGNGKVIYTLGDIVHQTFSDFGLLCPGIVGRYFGLQGELDPEHTTGAIMELVVNFLLLDPANNAEELNNLIAAKNYSFIQQGTDIAKEELDKVEDEFGASAETGEAEEKRISEGGEVDAQEAK